MCGRFTLTVPTYEDLAEAFGVSITEGAGADYRPRFNMPPTDPGWILRTHHGVRELVSSSWGLVPRWSKALRDGGRPINARSEGIGARALFRDSLARRRCIVAADGFIEWEKVGKERRPFWFRPANGDLLLMAGIWDHWFDPEASKKICTFSILTTRANADVEALHDRMPVILSRTDIPAWISSPDTDVTPPVPDDVRAMMRPSAGGTLTKTRVSNRINSVKNDDRACLGPPSEEELVEAASPPPKKPRAAKKPAPEPALSLFDATAQPRVKH